LVVLDENERRVRLEEVRAKRRLDSFARDFFRVPLR
jgi:hypothetical protein